MRYRTELSETILMSERGQKIIDYVSPIYGESYVGLWIFEAIGRILDEVYVIADQLRAEGNASTSDLLLDYWEEHYGIPKNSALTNDQRRAALMAKIQQKGPVNPKKLENIISGVLGGVEVEITENIAKNTFLVNIREIVRDFTPVVAVLERMKPAHLIYQIRVATEMVSEADIKVAVALVHSEQFKVEVYG